MKIGIVHTSYLHFGGEDQVVEQETNYLRETNHEVSVFHFKNPTGRISKLISLLGSVFNVVSQAKISRWIQREKPDIIHLHNLHYQASAAVIYTIKGLGIPMIQTLHNFRLLCPSATLLNHHKIFLDSLYSHFPWKAVKNKVYRNSFVLTFLSALAVWVHKKLGTYKNIDRFICLTDHAKALFLSADNGFNFSVDDFVVKSNFVPRIDFKEMERGYHFLYVGRLSEEKGIRLMLEAFKGLPYTLKIIGEGDLEAEVQEASCEYQNIEYLGFHDHPFILDQLRHCAAMICPSIWFEGNPLTVIEAIGCGAPVICSKLGALESMVVNHFNGIHFSAGSSSDLKVAVTAFAGYPEETKNQFSENARLHYQNLYAPEKNIEKLLSIYKAVLHEKSRVADNTGKYGYLQ